VRWLPSGNAVPLAAFQNILLTSNMDHPTSNDEQTGCPEFGLGKTADVADDQSGL
jgi:hypothetical protein